MPLTLYSPVAGIKLEDLGVPMVSSALGVICGYSVPGWFDRNYPTWSIGPLNAGDVATIGIFAVSMLVASYSTDPMVKTISVLAGTTALMTRIVVRVGGMLAGRVGVKTAPSKQVVVSAPPRTVVAPSPEYAAQRKIPRRIAT
ncbi:MAG: hypothetical protein DRO14_06490 [Thermoprotei archaeon]|nr:MAG: hypothetical protein DRO14_06490 [Thermoprotei archaeon]